MRNLRLCLGIVVSLSAFSATAHAHHAMDGTLPQTFLQGLLSGFGHPIIGLDHFAFVVAVGLIASLHRRAYALPACFLAAMIIGIGFHLAALGMPSAEFAIALSVIVLGGLAIRARSLPVTVSAVLFALAGLFHGYAYGESILGAEAAPLIAYLIGLVAVQYAIAAGVVGLLRLDEVAALNAKPVRIAGGAVLGVGLVFLVNNLASLAA